MAQQRRGKRDHHRPRRAGRLAGLGLALILAASCTAEYRDPTGVGPNPPDIGQGGGGGGGGGPEAGSVLVGKWTAEVVFLLPADVQRRTTIWIFRPDGTCERTVETFSTLEDRTLVDRVDCAWDPAASTVSIVFDDHPGAVTFSWGLAAFSPDRLVLDGLEYARG